MATDVAQAVEQSVAAWGAAQWEALAAATAALGFSLERAEAQRLDALLKTLQGKRTSRILSRSDLLLTMREACESRLGIAYRNGGLGSVGRMVTTVALAVIADKWLTVGITQTGAIAGEPGRAIDWRHELQPWRKELAQNAERCRAWAKTREADRVRLPLTGPKPRAEVSSNPRDEKALLAGRCSPLPTTKGRAASSPTSVSSGATCVAS